MGYKLAGFEHLGGVEIDQRMAEIYTRNHKPKHFYLEDIRDFNQREDLPKKLFNLDILDGSPPCTSFSMCGKGSKVGAKKSFLRKDKRNKGLMIWCLCIATRLKN